MNSVIQELFALVERKRETIAELFTLRTVQTELEYDLAIERLEFRYDDEFDFTLYEARLTIVTSELSLIDSKIARLLIILEWYGQQIANL